MTIKKCSICQTRDPQLIRTCQLRATLPECAGSECLRISGLLQKTGKVEKVSRGVDRCVQDGKK